MTASQISNNPF